MKIAFQKLFKGVKERNSHLILSYSNNGMISQDEIIQIGNSVFGNQYVGDLKTREYTDTAGGTRSITEIHVREVKPVTVTNLETLNNPLNGYE